MPILDEAKRAAPGTKVYDKGEPGSVSGLYLKVTRTGKRWCLYYRTKLGQPRRPTLGNYPSLSLADARKVARAELVRVALGEDPRGVIQTQRAEMTVEELWATVYQRHYGAGSTPWAKEAAGLWTNYLAKPFAKLRLSQLTPVLVGDWHEQLAQRRPYRANRALAVLRKMFSWAERKGLVAPGTSPARPVRTVTEVSRGRLASDAEIKAIVSTLEAARTEDPHGAALLLCLLLTGARPKSLELATWDQFRTLEQDGRRMGLLVFTGKSTRKTGEQEQVVFPERALAIVEQLERSESDPRIFQRSKLSRALWKRAREAAGAPDLRARDLRRTFASVAFNSGMDKGLVGRLLNHSSPQTTDIYARLSVGSRARGVESIAQVLDGILGNEDA